MLYIHCSDVLSVQSFFDHIFQILVIFYHTQHSVYNSPSFSTTLNFTESILEICGIGFEESGQYTCEARNDNGVTTNTTTITVLEHGGQHRIYIQLLLCVCVCVCVRSYMYNVYTINIIHVCVCVEDNIAAC